MLIFLQEHQLGNHKILNDLIIKMFNNIISNLSDLLIVPKKRIQLIRIQNAKKIIIGSGGIYQRGWLATDRAILDVVDKNSFLKYWKPGSRLAFFSEHVWEHLTEYEAEEANLNCFEFLRSGGRLRIAVPDGYHTNKDYIEHVRPGGCGPGADDHKMLYNYKLLASKLKKAGFQIQLLEYWDENAVFHFKDWDPKHGYVRRSRRFDNRNKDGNLNYTSLIIDAIKP
jgi:predicted SAM-dependent methyltransferase